jgi:hypothetical protein
MLHWSRIWVRSIAPLPRQPGDGAERAHAGADLSAEGIARQYRDYMGLHPAGGQPWCATSMAYRCGPDSCSPSSNGDKVCNLLISEVRQQSVSPSSCAIHCHYAPCNLVSSPAVAYSQELRMVCAADADQACCALQRCFMTTCRPASTYTVCVRYQVSMGRIFLRWCCGRSTAGGGHMMTPSAAWCGCRRPAAAVEGWTTDVGTSWRTAAGPLSV